MYHRGALAGAVCSREFKEEITRYLEFKGLQADPDRVFALLKTMTER